MQHAAYGFQRRRAQTGKALFVLATRESQRSLAHCRLDGYAKSVGGVKLSLMLRALTKR